MLTLTLNRPDKRNALSSALVEALHAALERADLDAEVRVVTAARRGEGLLRRRRSGGAARFRRPSPAEGTRRPRFVSARCSPGCRRCPSRCRGGPGSVAGRRRRTGDGVRHRPRAEQRAARLPRNPARIRPGDGDDAPAPASRGREGRARPGSHRPAARGRGGPSRSGWCPGSCRMARWSRRATIWRGFWPVFRPPRSRSPNSSSTSSTVNRSRRGSCSALGSTRWPARRRISARRSPDSCADMSLNQVRLGLSLSGMVVAVVAIILNDRRIVWGAIALLAASLFLRLVIGRRRSAGGDNGV